MGLFSPGYKNEDKSKAIAALMRISDEAKLEKILPKIKNNDAAKFAAARISDPERINRLVMESENFFVRVTLIKKVTDEGILRKVAENDPHDGVSSKALSKITDEDYLTDFIVRFRKDEDRAYSAAKQLHTEALLVRVMTEYDEEHIVKGCIRALKDQVSDEALRQLSVSRSISARRYALRYTELKKNPPSNKPYYLYISNDPSFSSRHAVMETCREMKLFKGEDCEDLFQEAVEDNYQRNRILASDILQDLRPQIDRRWWEAHMDDRQRDQRLSWLVRKSPVSEYAALAVAGCMITMDEQKDRTELDCLYAHCSMKVITALEQVAKAGNTDAAAALKKLFASNKLNPQMAGYAARNRGSY